MERIVNSINGQLLAGKHILTARIPKRSTIQEEKLQVRDQSNSESVTTRYQNAGIWPFNKCLRDRLLRYSALLSSIRVEVEIILDRVVLPGSKREQISLTSSRFKAV